MFECFNESPVPFRGPEHEGRCLSDVTHTHQNRLMALPLALAVAASTATGLANPRVARADEMSDLQQRIEDSGSAYDEAQQRVDDAQAKIDAKVVDRVRREHQKALDILKTDRDKLDELAKFLYEKETITGEEFMEILNR